MLYVQITHFIAFFMNSKCMRFVVNTVIHTCLRSMYINILIYVFDEIQILKSLFIKFIDLFIFIINLNSIITRVLWRILYANKIYCGFINFQ